MCRDNKTEQEKINQFEDIYTKHDAVQWYTQNSFLFRLTNRAFRSEEIDQIYIFRLFITDLYKQLSSLYSKQEHMHDIKIYRGRKLMREELERLRNNIQHIISINGFLSATSSLDVALCYARAETSREGYESVVFELDIGHNQSKACVDISKYSKFTDEEEILCTIGTIWYIENIDWNNDTATWWVKLKLTNEKAQPSMELVDTLRKQYIDEECTLLNLANVLVAVGKYNQAQNYHKIMYDNLSVTDNQKIQMNNCLGILSYEIGEFDNAIMYFQKAEEIINSKQELFNHCQATICMNKQATYSALNNYTFAQEYFHKLTNIILTGLSANKHLMVKIYNNIGLSYHINNELDEALKNYARALVSDNPHSLDRSAVYNNIAGAHYIKKNYDKAKSYYTRAISIAITFR
ncbi:unnamed protein product [Didymodactylos carnosus]|uniref:Uncharacterized protein n=1 Tax=Didymodactylos carnosus TaxID=1234261 RepID=A0A814MPW4_9BILA|nr:unnamed protein product [Didymodactylos carnosus]CAF3846811.1 unnamed protein product [Didymodactylos carnosus]